MFVPTPIPQVTYSQPVNKGEKSKIGTTGARRGKSRNRCQTWENIQQALARKNLQLVPIARKHATCSTGKLATGVNCGKTCNMQVQENLQLVSIAGKHAIMPVSSAGKHTKKTRGS